MGNKHLLDRTHTKIKKDPANLKQRYTNGASDHDDSWWSSRSAEAQQYRALLKGQLQTFFQQKKDGDENHNNTLLANLGELQRFAIFLHEAQQEDDNRQQLQALLYKKANKPGIQGETASACLITFATQLGDTLGFDAAPSFFEQEYQKSKDAEGKVQDPERDYQKDSQRFQLRESLFDTWGLLSLLEGTPHATLQNLMPFGNVLQSLKNLVIFRRTGINATDQDGTIIVGELGKMVTGSQTATSTVRDKDARVFKEKQMTLTLTMTENTIDVKVKHVTTRASKRYPGITQLVETARLMRDQGQWHTEDGRQCVATLRLYDRAQDKIFNRHEEAQLARALKLANQVGLAVKMDDKNQIKMNAWVDKQRERFESSKGLRNTDLLNQWGKKAPCQLHTHDEPYLAYLVNQDLANIIDRFPQRPTAGLSDIVTDFSQAQHSLAMLATLAVDIAVDVGHELKTTVKDLQTEDDQTDKEPLGKLLYIAKLKETWMKRFADDPKAQNELEAHWSQQLKLAASLANCGPDNKDRTYNNLKNTSLEGNLAGSNTLFAHVVNDESNRLLARCVGITENDLNNQSLKTIADAILVMQNSASEINNSCNGMLSALENAEDSWSAGMRKKVEALQQTKENDSDRIPHALRELRDAFCNRTQAPSVVVSDDIKAQLAKDLEKEIEPESSVTPTQQTPGMGSTSF